MTEETTSLSHIAQKSQAGMYLEASSSSASFHNTVLCMLPEKRNIHAFCMLY